LGLLGARKQYSDRAEKNTHCPACTGGTSGHAPRRCRRCLIVRRQSRSYRRGVSVTYAPGERRKRTGHSCGPARSRRRSGDVVSKMFRWQRAKTRPTHAEITLTVDRGQRGRARPVERPVGHYVQRPGGRRYRRRLVLATVVGRHVATREERKDAWGFGGDIPGEISSATGVGPRDGTVQGKRYCRRRNSWGKRHGSNLVVHSIYTGAGRTRLY
jgi:hypothetical protein